ncbi:hypothetical protein RS130_20720 [Paraglaciecola aquimarina]|uniref:Uncharacterized protein n=1 Tax=Paraglaciecola aquimarina TaxID=1235557 RepID=A0ABU3T164_9ALTE|nr:hypothetical protein [Paraglaciecola aquimarina]MDU0355991.1 hypothetical protein [Paraglaciecola aquimarina]
MPYNLFALTILYSARYPFLKKFIGVVMPRLCSAALPFSLFTLTPLFEDNL